MLRARASLNDSSTAIKLSVYWPYASLQFWSAMSVSFWKISNKLKEFYIIIIINNVLGASYKGLDALTRSNLPKNNNNIYII